MAEIKPITDFYDPTKAFDSATRYMQGQQHLALQAQQVQQQQANQEIDNLKQAAQVAITENPSQAAPVYNAYMKRIGGPQVTDSNAFSAQPQHFWDQLNYPPDSQEWKNATQAIDNMGVTTRKRSREEFERQGMLQGAGEAITAAGGTATSGSKAYVAQSEQTQREIGQAIYDPKKQAEAALNKEHMNQVAEIHGELKPLIDVGFNVRDQMEALGKLTPKIAAAQANYEKDLKSNKGMAYASGARNEALAGDPAVSEYLKNATASIPKIEAQLSQLTTARQATRREAAHLAAGTKVQSMDVSYETLLGTTRYQDLHKSYLEAQLALARDPMNPAKHQAVAQVAQAMNARATELHQSRTALDVRQDALRAAAHEKELAHAYTNATAQGQQIFGALPKEQQTAQSAARVSREIEQSTGVKVKAEDILIKDPNRPPVGLIMKEEGAEAKKVGEGFGEQYLESQKAGRAALLKESKLNRMETLLSGMDTGKITPAMTEVAALGQAFGIEIDPKLGAKQAMIALSNEIALDFRNPAGGAGMPGNLSNYDLQFLRSMPPDLAKTPAGNKLIIETARQIAKRDQHTAKMARTYRKEHGHIDEGFYDEMTDYAEAHPLFKNAAPGQATPGTANSANPQLAPFDDPEWEKKYQEQFKPKFKGEHK